MSVHLLPHIVRAHRLINHPNNCRVVNRLSRASRRRVRASNSSDSERARPSCTCKRSEGLNTRNTILSPPIVACPHSPSFLLILTLFFSPIFQSIDHCPVEPVILCFQQGTSRFDNSSSTHFCRRNSALILGVTGGRGSARVRLGWKPKPLRTQMALVTSSTHLSVASSTFAAVFPCRMARGQTSNAAQTVGVKSEVQNDRHVVSAWAGKPSDPLVRRRP